MTAQEYRELCAKIERQVDALWEKAHSAYDTIEMPHIDTLRPATPSDVVVGAVFYYPTRPNPYWHIVEAVRYPDDDFKAYVAEDGCRYGLDGAHVHQELKT